MRSTFICSEHNLCVLFYFFWGTCILAKILEGENVIVFLFDGMHNLLLDVINIVGGVVL